MNTPTISPQMRLPSIEEGQRIQW